MVVLDQLGDLLRETDFFIQMADFNHSPDDDFQGTNF
jgi:hypothetical protein